MCATGLCESSRDKEHSCCLPPCCLCCLAFCAYVCRWQQVKTRRAPQWPLRRCTLTTPAAAWHFVTRWHISDEMSKWKRCQVMKPQNHFLLNECQSVKLWHTYGLNWAVMLHDCCHGFSSQTLVHPFCRSEKQKKEWFSFRSSFLSFWSCLWKRQK